MTEELAAGFAKDWIELNGQSYEEPVDFIDLVEFE